MADQCLVLNASWIPIETVTWQEAFVQVFKGRASIVDYYEEIIKTPSDEYLKPAVIVCKEYNGIPKRESVYSRRNILLRDNYVCQYCSKKLTSSNATLDHVVPRSKGGRSTFQNVVCCCESCNTRKANKSLKEAKMKLLRIPKAPKLNPIKAKFNKIKVNPEWAVHLKHYVNVG